ncbi:MAG TPA: tetratricopeptide repeat protein, partial [Gemmataceae bacterium]
MSEWPAEGDDSLGGVDRRCDAFEDAWQQGQRPRIEDYLGDASGEEGDALLRWLIPLDVKYRWQHEETPDLRYYLSLSPTLSAGWLAAVVHPGVTLADRYDVGAEIGVGGIAVVHLGQDRWLKRPVAVKVLREQYQHHADLVRRFEDEARITSRLQHPGIVPIHDLGKSPDGRPCITMKLVEGHDLAKLLEQRVAPSQDLPRFLTIFEQICQTLAYAHAQGVIHRDLKPRNIMVGAFGEVHLMDWGFAKELHQAPCNDSPSLSTAESPVVTRIEDTVAECSGTQAGQVFGSLPYMPPEQASGDVVRVDERSDVFGLGAILCEILIGAPPFRGADATEVLDRAKACDHAEAMGHLDDCGADAALLQLTKACLAAEPADRPRDAGVVAEAVKGYLTEVQERLQKAERDRAAAQARGEEARKTVAAEQRARRRTVWLAMAVLFIGFGGGGAGLWWTWRQAELVRLGNMDLTEFTNDLREWKIPEARRVMERAEVRAANGGPAELLRQVEQMRADLTLVEQLDKIRLDAATWSGNDFDYATADRDYATVFRERGLAVEGDDPEMVAARIQGSAIKAQLVAALDDWAMATAVPARRAWLLQVARRAEPGEWSDRFRDPVVWSKPAALEQLAKEAKVAELSPQLLNALGLALMRQPANPLPILTAAQERHPADFWLNFYRGNAVLNSNPEEAIGYYRAALAVRPKTSAVYNNLGLTLRAKHDLDGAITCYKAALALDPKFAGAYDNLGLVLHDKHDLDGAITCHKIAITLNPKLAQAHNNLGFALHDKHDLDGAIPYYKTAIALNPKYAMPHYNLGNALRDNGDRDGAIAYYKEAIALNPKYAPAHCNLGSVLSAKGQRDEAISEYHKAIELDPKLTVAHYNLGNEMHVKSRLDDAIAYYRKVIELDPKHALAHYNLGNEMHVKSQLDDAIAEYKEAIRLKNDFAEAHCNLGQVLQQKGQFAEALEYLRRGHQLGSQNPNWRYPSAQWVRQCERLIELDRKLPAILRGEAEPADAAERLALADLCYRYKRLYADAARLYADAFTAEPKLAADLNQQHRYNAACSAALAAAGQGEDARLLPDKDATMFRRRALDWLREELAAYGQIAPQNNPAMKQTIQKRLAHWQRDPDLAGVREPEQLAKLPPAEKEEWRRLWAGVASMAAPSDRVGTPAAPPLKVGQEMDLAGPTVQGEKFDLKQLRGKVVLIDFWATWCGPCVAEMPNVKRAYDRYHKDGFEVVGVSLDNSKEKLVEFLKTKEVPWPQLFFAAKGDQGWNNPLARKYGVRAIPSTILVDRAG